MPTRREVLVAGAGGILSYAFHKFLGPDGKAQAVNLETPVEVPKTQPPKLSLEEISQVPWFPETIKRWDSMVEQEAQKRGIDPLLPAIIILVESGGHPYAVSKAGALGLGQVMPGIGTTFTKETGRKINLLLPEDNIAVTAWYLQRMYNNFKDWAKAIAAYYAGPGNVSGGLGYSRRVMGLLESAKEGKAPSSVEGFLVNQAKSFFNLDPRIPKALDFAVRQLGEPYLWGGTGPDSWDCSGLVQAAYKAAGVSIPRVVATQWTGRGRILRSEEPLQVGDLIAFVNSRGNFEHTGIIIYPQGRCFIEATGSYGRVKVSSLDYPPRSLNRGDLAPMVKGYKRIIG